jgi:hypothetical protein
MGALLVADGSSGGADPVEDWARSGRATAADTRSLRARWLPLSVAAFDGERR